MGEIPRAQDKKPMVNNYQNNGSRDGDSAAAYRYTECKLSKVGEEMLSDIKKNTVDWQNAYTDVEEEPVYLPGKFPNLLVNGTTGIAVGMACSFAPHNLNEIMNAAIYTIEHPDCDVKELLQFISGPDFPTGGIIINKDELPSAYLTGRGRVRIRGEYVIESDKSGDSIVFTSIPYKATKPKIIEDLDKLCENGEITGISSIRDESNHKGVRLVIELMKGVSAEPIIAKAFKNTQLEDTYSINQVALVDKKPQLRNIKQLIEVYNEHQKDVLLRKTQFDYDKIMAKLHILDGLLIALEDIDNVIAMIKKSDSASAAKDALIAKYKFSEAQAKAILDMKLAKLAKLEKVEILNEKRELAAKGNELAQILQNPVPELIKIFNELKSNYGDERRTKIIQEATTKEEKEIEFVEPEKCVVVMTESGLIKRIPTSSFRAQKRNGKGVKTQDDITAMTIRTNTIDNLMIFSTKGKMYRLLVNDIPVGTNSVKGQSVKSLIAMDTDEEPSVIYSIYRDTDAKYVLFTTKNGMVKKTSLEEYIKTKKKTGIVAINLKDDDELVSVNLVKDEDIILLTADGYGIRFNSMDIGPTSRATTGVKGINLNKGDEVVSALILRNKDDYLAVFSDQGLGKKFKASELMTQKRGGKGLICYKSENGSITCGALVDDTDLLLVCGNCNAICVEAKEIPLLGRASMGNQIIKNNRIMSVSKI